MSDDLILDINCKQITEWLLERKKIPQDYQKKLKAANLKIKKIIDSHTVSDTQIQDYIHQNKENLTFFEINKICEDLLKTNEAQQKGFFGGYSSKLITDWLALKEYLKKDNIHIVDIAKIISQNLNFEVPNLKKNIKSLDQLQTDSNQRVQDFKNSIKFQQQEYSNNCSKLGIQGENIQQEIPDLLKNLPESLEKIQQKLQSETLKKSLNYYYDFTLYNNTKTTRENIQLKLLEYLIEKGDSTVEYYKQIQSGQQPTQQQIENNQNRYENYKRLNSKFELPQKTEVVEIPPAEIDWDYIIQPENVQVETENQNKNEVNFDEFFNYTVDTTAYNNNNTSNNCIDWDIEIITDDNNKQASQSNIITVKDLQDTILSTRDLRNEAITCLEELQYFLKQRLIDSKNFSQNSLIQAYDQSTAGNLFEVSAESLQKQIDHIQDILDDIQNYKFRQLLQIKEDPKTQDRLINYLNQFKKNINKNEQLIRTTQKKIDEITDQLDQSRGELKNVTSYTIQLKNFVQQLLSEILKRKVNIIGDINKL